MLLSFNKTMRIAGALTAAFVADGAVGDGAALGDGHGHGRLDAGLARGVGQHDGAQALGAAPDGAQQLGGTAARGFCVAAAHGASLSATWSTGTRPHSPAPCAVSSPARPATRSMATTQRLLAWSSIS